MNVIDLQETRHHREMRLIALSEEIGSFFSESEIERRQCSLYAEELQEFRDFVRESRDEIEERMEYLYQERLAYLRAVAREEFDLINVQGRLVKAVAVKFRPGDEEFHATALKEARDFLQRISLEFGADLLLGEGGRWS
jgi:BMFP domain-containing protein YqiC